MMKKHVVAAVCVMALGAVASGGPVAAEDGRNTAAIAGLVAGGIIGAAIGSHQHDQGYPDYRPHPNVPPGENAVGACVHYGNHKVKEAGGYRFQMDKLRDVTYSGATARVVMNATSYYPWGHNYALITCVVRDHNVIEWKRG